MSETPLQWLESLVDSFKELNLSITAENRLIDICEELEDVYADIRLFKVEDGS